jgi:hypothetical protein
MVSADNGNIAAAMAIGALAFKNHIQAEVAMEFPEPYNSLPISKWHNYMKAHPRSYATLSVRAWLRSRRKYRLICREQREESPADKQNFQAQILSRFLGRWGYSSVGRARFSAVSHHVLKCSLHR